jgi:hypothetical protein
MGFDTIIAHETFKGQRQQSSYEPCVETPPSTRNRRILLPHSYLIYKKRKISEILFFFFVAPVALKILG